MDAIVYHFLSEYALMVSFGNTISLKLHRKVIHHQQLLEKFPFKGLLETVPAYNSLTIYFKPEAVDSNGQSPSANVKQYVEHLFSKHSGDEKNIAGSLVEIPVCYDPSLTKDLVAVSEQLRLSIDDIIGLHTGRKYKVYMTGFTPGFPYLGILHDALVLKRKEKPDLKVHPGSVAIAGNQTGIYPLATPGGWHIIGRTPLHVFDPEKENPFLLKAGDEVIFKPITREAFETFS